MRLPGLDHPRGLKARLIYLFTKLRLGATPDILKVMLYRRPFFGALALSAIHGALRGPSRLSFADRELIAAATAAAHSSQFCATNHSVWASYGLDTKISPEALDDPTSLPVDQGARAALVFARKLAGSPDDLKAEDVNPMRFAGVEDEDIRIVVHVASLFTTVSLISNALGFTVLTEEQSRKLAPRFFKRGYRM